jgi:hypothetical protein
MEIIKIVSLTDVIDNWGRTETVTDPLEIQQVLLSPEEWTDDLTFTDDRGQVYWIDDLIDREVELPGVDRFRVIE